MNNIKIALLVSNEWDRENWKDALEERSIKFDTVNILCDDWLTGCTKENYDIYIVKSPGETNSRKQIFDERIQILHEELGKNIFPSLLEIRLHENKKYLASWLKAKGIKCPQTNIALTLQEAYAILDRSDFPLVAKMNIGSSGKGVRILKSRAEALSYVKTAFRKGMKPWIGPNLRTASPFVKLKNALNSKTLVKKRLNYYKAVWSEPQKYVILQEFIKHDFEWRVVVMGNSFFAHKKVNISGMASGSLAKNYDNPPLDLLIYAKELRDRFNIRSAAIDLFQYENQYLVNEIQTYFGQSDDYQMMVDGVVGRYRYLDEEWIFEPGDWARKQCYPLRLEFILNEFK